MTKVSPKILDRVKLLREKGLLQEHRRHLAAEYSTELVPIDSLARIKVELKVTDTKASQALPFANIGGALVEVAAPIGALVVWIPPERLQWVAELIEVQSIGTMAARGHFTDVDMARSDSSGGSPSVVVAVRRVLTTDEPTSTIVLELRNGDRILGTLVTVDDSTIVVDQDPGIRRVGLASVAGVLVPVHASRGTTWERIYPSK